MAVCAYDYTHRHLLFHLFLNIWELSHIFWIACVFQPERPALNWIWCVKERNFCFLHYFSFYILLWVITCTGTKIMGKERWGNSFVSYTLCQKIVFFSTKIQEGFTYLPDRWRRTCMHIWKQKWDTFISFDIK